MAIGANSYGSVAEVEALTGRYTNAGSYDGTTRPTLTQVEKFIDRVSALLNMLLAEQGYEIPVSQADAKLVCDEFAVEQAVQLCHGANGAGPFAPGSEELRGRTAFRIISQEASVFVGEHAAGLGLLGATRTRALTFGLEATLTDTDGDDLEKMFSREDWE
jgi:hypothetical protein